MLEFLVNPSWILNYRSEFLTSFFSVFPIFASDYFYIACISAGYWRSYRRMWVALGFLIPCVTLMNCIFKYLFRIGRPDFVLHLVPVEDSYGFPSGDVMVAYVFWVRLYYEAQNLYQKLFYIFLLICISFSRIYLGVHSVFDVLGAMAFGWVILDMWYKIDLLNPDFLKEKLYRFWLIPIYLGGVYILVAGNLAPASMAIKSFGALLGFALALTIIRNNFDLDIVNNPVKILFAFMFLVLLAVLYPKIYFINEWIRYGYIALKYMILTFMIFGIVPFILNRAR